jgi:hypothetical protein
MIKEKMEKLDLTMHCRITKYQTAVGHPPTGSYHMEYQCADAALAAASARGVSLAGILALLEARSTEATWLCRGAEGEVEAESVTSTCQSKVEVADASGN